MKKLDMIVIGPGPAPPTAVIRRKSLCQQLNLKKKSKLLQVDAIRREYPIADVQKRWQSCQTFIDVLGKGILKQLITELS